MGYQKNIEGQLARLGVIRNRGLIDASSNPLFPPALRGDTYTILNDGIIGLDAIGNGLEVKNGDKIQAVEENSGGFYAKLMGIWSVIQANVDSRLNNFSNQVEQQELLDEHIDPNFSFLQREYTLVNRNLLLLSNVVIRPSPGKQLPFKFTGNALRLPRPISSSSISGSLQSQTGDLFSYRLEQTDGSLRLGGTFRSSGSLSINITPYIAVTPLEFVQSGI